MSENAVFTEVLEIQVSTDQFATDMAKVEAAYTAAIQRMNAASATVGSIGGENGFENAGKQLNELNQSVAAGSGYWERFGNALDRASVRLPAMLIVASAMAAAFETVKAPIDALADGFKNLEESAEGTGFRSVAEDLDKLKTHFESVAATPVFDFVSEEMGGLKKWLTENKVYVDNLALAFGQMIADFLKQLTELGGALGQAGVFNVLGKAAASIGYALGSAVISLRAMIQLAAQGAQTFAAMGQSIMHPGDKDSWNTDINGIGARVDEIIRKHDEDQRQLTQLTENLYDAIDGKRNAKIPNTPEKSSDTLPDVKAKFAEEVAAVKAAAEEKAEAIQRAIHTQELSHTEAAPKIHGIIENEKTAIQSLITKYDQLAAAAIRASGKGTFEEQDAQITQTRNTFAKVGISFDRAGSKQDTSADDAASDEQRKIKDDDLKSALDLLKTKNAALIQADSEYYKQGLETLQQFIAQKRTLVDEEYAQEKALIESRMASVGQETETYHKLANELAALNQAHTNKDRTTHPRGRRGRTACSGVCRAREHCASALCAGPESAHGQSIRGSWAP